MMNIIFQLRNQMDKILIQLSTHKSERTIISNQTEDIYIPQFDLDFLSLYVTNEWQNNICDKLFQRIKLNFSSWHQLIDLFFGVVPFKRFSGGFVEGAFT